jgi:hypothetical protein
MEAPKGNNRDDMELHTLANGEHKPSMMEFVHVFLSNMTVSFAKNPI